MAKHDPDLTRIFHALADPTRRAILAELGRGARPAGDLARPTGLALPTVMKHLACLQDARLIETEKCGRQRLCRLADADRLLRRHGRPERPRRGGAGGHAGFVGFGI